MTAKTPEELRERMVEAVARVLYGPSVGVPVPYSEDIGKMIDAALSAADSAGWQLVPKEAKYDLDELVELITVENLHEPNAAEIGETCAGCGKAIGMLDASYYLKKPSDDIGQTYHASCGTQSLIDKARAQAIEECAKAAEQFVRIDLNSYPPEQRAIIVNYANLVFETITLVVAHIRALSTSPKATP